MPGLVWDASRALADRVVDVLRAAGLPAGLRSDAGAEVDPNHDELPYPCAFVDWHSSPESTAAGVRDVLAGMEESPAMHWNYDVGVAMQRAVVDILRAGGLHAENYPDDMRTSNVVVRAEPPTVEAHGHDERSPVPSWTHAITTNGHINSEAQADEAQMVQLLGHRLRRLDGQRVFSIVLWALPPGVPWDRVNLDRWPQEYVQVAAQSQSRMTVEFRRTEAGRTVHYTLGHGAPRPSEPDAVVHWEQVETPVYADEVFAVDEVIEIFVHHYETGGVPEHVTLRRLDLP